MKLLLIDDSRFSRKQMISTLQQLDPNLEILEAGLAKEGRDLFDQTSPDLVLTDLVMPEEKGDTVIKHIRSKGSDCFVAVVSANIQEGVQREMMELGADFFLEKPIKQTKVEALMKAYYEKANRS